MRRMVPLGYSLVMAMVCFGGGADAKQSSRCYGDRDWRFQCDRGQVILLPSIIIAIFGSWRALGYISVNQGEL